MQQFDAEDLAYWYFRLNGFLVQPNFYVHGDDRQAGTRTDIDLLGVRFRHRREHLNDPMDDDKWMTIWDKDWAVFVEAKTGTGDFNKSWFRRDRKIMETFLGLLGAIPPKEKLQAETNLYNHGYFKSKTLVVTMVLLNNGDKKEITADVDNWPKVGGVEEKDEEDAYFERLCPVHLNHRHALGFIYNRLERYLDIKSDHSHWDAAGHFLWGKFLECHRDKTGGADFQTKILASMRAKE